MRPSMVRPLMFSFQLYLPYYENKFFWPLGAADLLCLVFDDGVNFHLFLTYSVSFCDTLLGS